jgi:hypothetical protein
MSFRGKPCGHTKVGAPERASADCSENAFLSRKSLCASWLISQRLAETHSRRDAPEQGCACASTEGMRVGFELDLEDSRRMGGTVSRAANGDLPKTSGASGEMALGARPRGPTWPLWANLGGRHHRWPGTSEQSTAIRAPTLTLREPRQSRCAQPQRALRCAPGTRAPRRS